MLKIAVDCDGVLANFTEGVRMACDKLWPGKMPPGYQPKGWDYTDLLTKDEWKKVWVEIKSMSNFWLKLPAFSDNVGALIKFFITARDVDVFIVTARTQGEGMTVARQTDIWLKSCGVMPLFNYLAVIPCEADDKARLYTQLGVKYSVDDKPSTVEACESLPNHRAYLLDQPWNQDAKPQRRIKSLEQYFSDVRSAAAATKS